MYSFSRHQLLRLRRQRDFERMAVLMNRDAVFVGLTSLQINREAADPAEIVVVGTRGHLLLLSLGEWSTAARDCPPVLLGREASKNPAPICYAARFKCVERPETKTSLGGNAKFKAYLA